MELTGCRLDLFVHGVDDQLPHVGDGVPELRRLLVGLPAILSSEFWDLCARSGVDQLPVKKKEEKKKKRR